VRADRATNANAKSFVRASRHRNAELVFLRNQNVNVGDLACSDRHRLWRNDLVAEPVATENSVRLATIDVRVFPGYAPYR
jgi:hypothetical protein